MTNSVPPPARRFCDHCQIEELNPDNPACLICKRPYRVSPSSHTEDRNGHKIGPGGELVFDERCHGCDAPSPDDMQQLLACYDRWLNGMFKLPECSVPRRELEVILAYVRQLEKEHREMRRHLEDTPTTDDDLVVKTGKLLDSITLRP